jgi:hypothetical protein
MSVHWTYQIPAVATRLFLAGDVVQVSGRNCVFGVRSNVHFNDTLVIAVMSGTAMFALPLPPPSYTMPSIVSPFTQARDPALTMLKEQIVDMVKVNASELQSEIVVPRRRARSATMTRGDTDDMSDGSSTHLQGTSLPYNAVFSVSVPFVVIVWRSPLRLCGCGVSHGIAVVMTMMT